MEMKRIAILTAGGDTPALNATLHGAVTRANQVGIEVLGLLEGFRGLLSPNLPHILLNPLFQCLPYLDPTHGGTILGSSRQYVDSRETGDLDTMLERLKRLQVDGLICVGGDGTLSGMKPLSVFLPVVLAPKTIDNDLGLNYLDEAEDYELIDEKRDKPKYRKRPERDFQLEEMINFVTPGYATAVYVTSRSVQRIRTTAESHRRIAIIEVMGRHCGMIALGTAYGQPDMILIPEAPPRIDDLVEVVKRRFRQQHNVVICIAEGFQDEEGEVRGIQLEAMDPAGVRFEGAAESLAEILRIKIGDKFFKEFSPHDTAQEAIFIRKVGHDQRGGRPIHFDRFHGAMVGAHAVTMLAEGKNDALATLQYENGNLSVASHQVTSICDPFGRLNFRPVARSFYDPQNFQPTEKGKHYLHAIFANALHPDDLEHTRSLFDQDHLRARYHSINVDINKMVRRLGE